MNSLPILFMVNEDSVMVMGAVAVASVPAARGQGLVRSAEGLGQ
ncbi:hypothetical protein YTPLAS72_01050 [Nitrospira sp.]|nr:hypothetical protein YTPLAS72_01050 [Nitrospira sp.]